MILIKFSFFHLLVVIEASVLFVHKGTNRIDVIYEALYSAIVASVATLIFSLINGYSYEVLAGNTIIIILNVICTYVAVSVILPILEKIFNLPTQFRLHELSAEYRADGEGHSIKHDRAVDQEEIPNRGRDFDRQNAQKPALQPLKEENVRLHAQLLLVPRHLRTDLLQADIEEVRVLAACQKKKRRFYGRNSSFIWK